MWRSVSVCGSAPEESPTCIHHPPASSTHRAPIMVWRAHCLYSLLLLKKSKKGQDHGNSSHFPSMGTNIEMKKLLQSFCHLLYEKNREKKSVLWELGRFCHFWLQNLNTQIIIPTRTITKAVSNSSKTNKRKETKFVIPFSVRIKSFSPVR